MSAYHKKQKEKRRKNLFRKWHRRVGFSAALFLVNLAVTGILLNHSESLQLHKQFVKSDWLVSWYGVKAPDHAVCFTATNTLLCQIGNKRILGDQLIDLEASELIGLVEFEGLYYVSDSKQIALYTQQWELVETIKLAHSIPHPIRKIGKLKPTAISGNTNGSEPQQHSTLINYQQAEAETNAEIAKPLSSKLNPTEKIFVSAGQKHYVLDTESLSWRAIEIQPLQLEVPHPADEYPLSKLQNIYLDHQINYLKLVQDLHSGRILKTLGTWATDLVAVIIILLAISGFLAWQKRTNKLS